MRFVKRAGDLKSDAEHLAAHIEEALSQIEVDKRGGDIERSDDASIAQGNEVRIGAEFLDFECLKWDLQQDAPFDECRDLPEKLDFLLERESVDFLRFR